MWFLYEVLLIFGLLLYVPGALWRRRLPHPGWSMRFGRYPAAVTAALQGRSSMWIHAVSVGEVLAARPLLQALSEACPQYPIAFSTITPGGFDVASRAIAGRGVALYGPLDVRGCVEAALTTLHPRLLALVESELWPMVIHLATARGIPVVVVNGRISSTAFRRYQWVKPWLSSTLSRIDLFLMQSQGDADRVIQLGAPADVVRVTGNLKWDASVGARPTPHAVQETRVRLGLTDQELAIVAGSTHRGEEAPLLEAFRRLRTSRNDARLIIAPRHLERVAEVDGLIHRAGFSSKRISQPGIEPWDVAIVDVFGQLPCYFGLSSVSFIGGSLIPHGGQNPLEAASLGKPIVFGPFMHNFADITQQLIAHEAAQQIRNATELSDALQHLVADPAAAQAMGRRAQELTERSQGATHRTLEAIRPLLAK